MNSKQSKSTEDEEQELRSAGLSLLFFMQAVGSHQFSSFPSLSCVWLCEPMDCSTPGLPVHYQLWSLLKLMPIEPNHLILCRPLLLLPPITPSIRVFSNEAGLRIRCSKYWSFSFSISPSNEHPGLISFRMDWLDLLAVQGALKSLLQHHSSKAWILWCSLYFWPLLLWGSSSVGKRSFCSTIQVMLPKVGRAIAKKQKQKIFLIFCELHKIPSKVPALYWEWDICICIADSLCYTLETNTIL